MDYQNQTPNEPINGSHHNAAKYSDITRYLCAAAYWDREFRDYVFKEIVSEEHRAISQVIDVDLITVVKHCFAARRRETIRNIVIALILLLFILGFPLLLIRLEDKLWVLYFTALCAFFIWLTNFVDLWHCYCTTILGRLARGKFDPDAINVRLHPQLMRKLIEVQTANVVIYKNAPQEKLFEEPFIIGSGFAYKKWPSLQVDITKGKRTLGTQSTPQRFQLAELYNHLIRRLKDLKMSEMTIADRLYVDGHLIRTDQRFLTKPSARPSLHISDSDLTWLIEGHNTAEHVRHYKCIQLGIPRTYLVMSVFVKFSILGPYLDAEAGFYLLPPITYRFAQVDSVVFTPIDVLRILKASIPARPSLLLHAPLNLLGTLLSPQRLWRQNRQIERGIRKNPYFDYGATSNIRMFERVNSLDYFAKVDTRRYVTSIELCILNSLYEFLDSKNIDTADRSRQETFIINTGLIVHDSTINAEGIAVGDKNIIIGRQAS
jgi:hypothetical protein